MFKNSYSRDVWISMSYLLLSLGSSLTAGWVILLFAFLRLGNLLKEVTGSNEYNRDIITLTSLYSVLIIFTLMSYILFFSNQLTDIFLFIFYIANLIIGISYIKWGFHLNILQNDLFKLKRQLVVIVIILGICFVLFGVLGASDIFIDGILMRLEIDLYGKLCKPLSVLLVITIGLIFLRASKDCAINNKN